MVTLNVRSKRQSNRASCTFIRKQWTCLILSTDQPIERSIDLANHTEAFFWAVGQQLSGVRRKFRSVSEEIASLAIPSDEFLFNEAYRDSLIFEDASYSNSKTYFWALQSLRTVNDSISHLIAAWESFETCNLSDFLNGQNEKDSIAQQQPAGNNISFLEHINEEIVKLKKVQTLNLERQEEIESLRDGLFNASTVLEARTTVLQGRNIELLTYISMVFLPASFVTSVFGMDILISSVDIRDFAIIFVAVCGMTYATILLFRLANPFRHSTGSWSKGDEDKDHGTNTSRGPFDWRSRKPFRWRQNAGDRIAHADLETNKQT
ncbi:hypothetical protein P171DRAFT_519221 [Karstenula rhodostoma CBS 690.94]|uniref:Uncharacterized protein n=1 Tax=Karstenula rhodostoma CBS 690.94 TaxID=1392251 RepID=A0A9P4UDZ8_9PLEO|nr:hypothetical protein P171DRAFT_519221 [Karstenula rhodostoma CBS 690.94]